MTFGPFKTGVCLKEVVFMTRFDCVRNDLHKQ